jgi:hydrogenase nickel incorporation protein HypA/HybF
MHEISLCEGVLQILEDHAQRQGFHQVKRVWLEIGALSGVDPGAMRFGFDAVMKGSLAEGAVLEIIELSGQAWCMPCGKSVPVQARFEPCPECGSHQLQITGGDEMRIKELEVD